MVKKRYLPKDLSIKYRKHTLTQLSDAYRKRNEEARWIEVKPSDTSANQYIRSILASLLRLGLIETKIEKDDFGNEKSLAKITLDGLYALENDAMTYHDLQKSLQVQMPIYNRLEEIAKKLDIRRAAGRGAGQAPSVLGLLIGITGRQESFVRWFKHVYSGEYVEKQDE